jgi:hypothetical protein
VWFFRLLQLHRNSGAPRAGSPCPRPDQSEGVRTNNRRQPAAGAPSWRGGHSDPYRPKASRVSPLRRPQLNSTNMKTARPAASKIRLSTMKRVFQVFQLIAISKLSRYAASHADEAPAAAQIIHGVDPALCGFGTLATIGDTHRDPRSVRIQQQPTACGWRLVSVFLARRAPGSLVGHGVEGLTALR